MNPKEKAESLLNRFNKHAKADESDKARSGEVNAKEISLILADVMVYELSDLPRIPYNERRTEYWRNVKLQIEKLGNYE